MKHGAIPWRGWVLVCDGAKALILRNEGDAELVNLRRVEVFAESQLPTHELGADRPGRVHESHDGSRSAVASPDLHLEREIAFLGTIAATLDKMVRDHAVKALVVVAPPKALGLLRDRLSPAVRAIVTTEIPKDLVKLPIDEIEHHLIASLAPERAS
jgi:protein required for attachment to host cells